MNDFDSNYETLFCLYFHKKSNVHLYSWVQVNGIVNISLKRDGRKHDKDDVDKNKYNLDYCTTLSKVGFNFVMSLHF